MTSLGKKVRNCACFAQNKLSELASLFDALSLTPALAMTERCACCSAITHPATCSIDDSPAAPLPTSPTSERQRSTQLNIACAKRVQSFLQAMFIEYGENKQFLSFSEISPNYFNIPEKEKGTFFEGCLNDDCAEKEKDE
ncbi:hypothetical protein QQG55_2065 [Brugia pahangi]